MNILNNIAAKSNRTNQTEWLSFQMHMLDTAYTIEYLYQHWLPDAVRMLIASSLGIGDNVEELSERACDYCCLAALLHDIGKLTPVFQKKISDNILGYKEHLLQIGVKNLSEYHTSIPHAALGAEILRRNSFPESFCEMIGAHHGKYTGQLHAEISTYPEYYYGSRKIDQEFWEARWKQWITLALQRTGFTLKELPEANVPCQMLITGLLIMADWIASNPAYFPLLPYPSLLSEEQMTERADQAWDSLGLPHVLRIMELDVNWFEKRFGFEPNAVQKQMADIISGNSTAGIYILEAPMGIGKTEAALASAEILMQKLGLGGVYFGLPTQATANGIFKRIEHWASKIDPDSHAIRLAHGMTDLNEEYRAIFHGTAADADEEKLIVHAWFEGRKQALLAEYVVATVDQFLLASLKQKHVMMRHLGLAGKVVIIDECHAYDAYMNVYLDHALTWMGAYGVPVIILSATLPQKRRTELIRAYLCMKKGQSLTYQSERTPYAYPVLTWTSGDKAFQHAIALNSADYEIEVNHIAENTLTDVLWNRLRDGGCAAIIVNTVDYAQQLAARLETDLPGYEILCFHSKFIATDRSEIERMLLSRTGRESNPETRNRLIVVGTQVLEQSLDLDFDYMVTELCPIDLLLQRSGRLHRHKNIRPEACTKPVLSIIEPTAERFCIYDPWILQQTAKHLPDILHIPSQIPKLVEAVYSAHDEEDALYLQYCRKTSDQQAKAKGYCIQSENLQKKRYNLLSDFLDDDLGGSLEAEASVRDAEESIEVIVLCKYDDSHYCTVNQNAVFDRSLPLDSSEAKQIARERLRLPLWFSKYHFNDTVKSLENVMPDSWKESRWLNGELLLLLDSSMQTVLIGKTLQYSRKYGLQIRKVGE